MNRLATFLGVLLVIGYTGPVIFSGIALLAMLFLGISGSAAVVLGFFATVGIFVATIVNAIFRNQR